jgi:integrase
MTTKGYVFKDRTTGKWYARLTITDTRGKRRNIKKTAGTKGEARALLAQLVNDLEERGTEAIEIDRLTFADLASAYSDFKVKPAEYRGDQKISGLRSVRTVRYRVAALVEYFGKMRLRSITLGEIERFKQQRLRTRTKNGRERSIAAVHRELEILRAMLRFARNEGWLDVVPFERASTPVISKAAETKRTRMLSFDEEARLLAVCDGPREHLRPLVIAALDTGCRKGELLSLTWSDIDLASRTIRIRAMTTKRLSERSVPISQRFAVELESLRLRFPDRRAR